MTTATTTHRGYNLRRTRPAGQAATGTPADATMAPAPRATLTTAEIDQALGVAELAGDAAVRVGLVYGIAFLIGATATSIGGYAVAKAIFGRK
jgi:hypothetical protein